MLLTARQIERGKFGVRIGGLNSIDLRLVLLFEDDFTVQILGTSKHTLRSGCMQRFKIGPCPQLGLSNVHFWAIDQFLMFQIRETLG